MTITRSRLVHVSDSVLYALGAQSHSLATPEAPSWLLWWSFAPVRGLAGQAAAARSHGGSVKLHRALLLLGVSQHAEPQQVREAYIRLAKVYHPDSGSPQASNQKFIQVSSTIENVSLRTW